MSFSFGDSSSGRPLDTNAANAPPSQRPCVSTGLQFGVPPPKRSSGVSFGSSANPTHTPGSGFSIQAAHPPSGTNPTTPSSGFSFGTNASPGTNPTANGGGFSFAFGGSTYGSAPVPFGGFAAAPGTTTAFGMAAPPPGVFAFETTPGPSNVGTRSAGVDMSCLFNKHEESDITLVVEGQEIPAHKIVLFASKSSLYDMCRNSNRVEIQDISHEDFLNKILFFIYTGQLQDTYVATLDEWIQLLKKADEFGLNGLKELVGDKIKRFILVENVLEVLRASVSFRAPLLQKHASAFIADVLSTPGTGYNTPVHNGIRSLAPRDEDGKMMAAVLIECMTPPH
eukprot:scaffold6829_cov171-Amphora_coffeaeformis.AAC.19